MTASGVSSIIRSTPVRVSIALIFLPSRPMILPFISSFGSATTDTVLSATWSAAHLWIAPVIIYLAFLSASSLALDSISFIMMEASCLTSFSILESSSALASSIVYPEILSSSSSCLEMILSRSFCLFMIFCSFWVMLSSFLSIFSNFLSMDSSFWMSLLSERCISARLSLASFSASLLSLWASSLASRIASFLNVSDLFSASSIRFFAFCSALPIAFSPTFFL